MPEKRKSPPGYWQLFYHQIISITYLFPQRQKERDMKQSQEAEILLKKEKQKMDEEERRIKLAFERKQQL